jgi:hypothetical protein
MHIHDTIREHDVRTYPKPTSQGTERGRQRRLTLSGGEVQNLADLCGAIDTPRVARDPGRSHGMIGDALEMVTPDLHGAKTPRHT